MLDYVNPTLLIDTTNLAPGEVHWRSPSNIALIKYWGKHGRQLPRNPSISFTLNNAYTDTLLSYQAKQGNDQSISLTFKFAGLANEPFRLKLVKFLEQITDIFPFLRQLDLRIESFNSFPHSAGIASSASSMSAIALCLCSLEHRFFGSLSSDEDFERKASFVARLGSGSACRSIYSHLAIWGHSGIAQNSSDLYAVPYEQHHEIFKTFHDDILLVSRAEKSVSSRAGHALMEGNIYAENRYTQARQRFQRLLYALQHGDLEQFGQITENEALTLHALMMTSNPSYLLMEPNSLHIIQRVRSYRAQTGYPVYFSLDAGPNIHLLYPDNVSSEIKAFIDEELSQYCAKGEWIADVVGEGPVEI